MAKAVTQKETPKQKILNKKGMKTEKTPKKEKLKTAAVITPENVLKGVSKSNLKDAINSGKKAKKPNNNISPNKVNNLKEMPGKTAVNGDNKTPNKNENDSPNTKLSKTLKRRLRRERKAAEKQKETDAVGVKALSLPNVNNSLGNLTRSQRKRLRRKKKREEMRQQQEEKKESRKDDYLPLKQGDTKPPCTGKLSRGEKKKLRRARQAEAKKLENKKFNDLEDQIITKNNVDRGRRNRGPEKDRCKKNADCLDDEEEEEEQEEEQQQEKSQVQGCDKNQDADEDEKMGDLEDCGAKKKVDCGKKKRSCKKKKPVCDEEDDDEDFDDDEDDDDDDDDDEENKDDNNEEEEEDDVSCKKKMKSCAEDSESDDFDGEEDEEDFDDSDEDIGTRQKESSEEDDEDFENESDYDQPDDSDDSDEEDGEDPSEEDTKCPPKKKRAKTDCEEDQVQKAKKSPSKAGEELTVFMGNVDFKATEEDVREFVEQVLAPGEIQEIELGKNPQGKPRGFGFLKVTTQEAFQKALKLNGEKLNNREVRMLKSEKRSDSRDSSAFRSNTRGGFRGGFKGRGGGSRGRGGFRGNSRGRGGGGRGGNFNGRRDTHQETNFKKRPWTSDSSRSFDKPKKPRHSDE